MCVCVCVCVCVRARAHACTLCSTCAADNEPHRLTALARPESFEIVGALVVKEGQAVLATYTDAAPMGSVHQHHPTLNTLHRLARIIERAWDASILQAHPVCDRVGMSHVCTHYNYLCSTTLQT